jgi:hypothetical protein
MRDYKWIFFFFVEIIIDLDSTLNVLQTRVYDNEVDPCGPVYITIGDGGNREGLALEWVLLNFGY